MEMGKYLFEKLLDTLFMDITARPKSISTTTELHSAKHLD